jgi:hypothetical protein
MQNERPLNERFLDLERDMADASILLEKGKANEIPFFIFDYDPKDELVVRDETKKLIKANPNIQEFDLFNIIVDLLKEEGYFDTVKEYEKEYDSDTLLSQLFQPFLSIETDDNPLIGRIMRDAKNDKDHIILITGVGKSYPIIRSHTILKKLQPIITVAPVVMMYPGRYNQKTTMCLKLFDRLGDDNYYRAFPLEERMAK